MQRFEYKVVPAPRRGHKGKGLKGAEARFAYAFETVINDAAAEGWEYLRTDTLPAEERSGIASKQTIYQNMLVFRRQVADAQAPDTALMQAQDDAGDGHATDGADQDHDTPTT